MGKEAHEDAGRSSDAPPEDDGSNKKAIAQDACLLLRRARRAEVLKRKSAKLPALNTARLAAFGGWFFFSWPLFNMSLTIDIGLS